MKKIRLILLFTCYAYLGSAQELTNREESLTKSMVSQSLLQNSNSNIQIDSVYYFNWLNCWKNQSKEKYTYKNNNLFLREVFNWDAVSGKFIIYSKDSSFYDATSRLKKKYKFIYNSSSSISKTIYEYGYDIANNTILMVMTDSSYVNYAFVTRDSFVYSNNLKVYEQRSNYTNNVLSTMWYNEWKYDSNNRLSENIYGGLSPIDGTKSFSNRELYVWENNDLVKTNRFSWNSLLSDWSNYTKDSSVYNSNHQLVEYNTFTFANSIWKKTSIAKYTYDVNGNKVKTVSLAEPKGKDSQIPIYQEQVLYNDNNLALETVKYAWLFYTWKYFTKSVTYYNASGSVLTNWAELCANNKYTFALSYKSCPSAVKEISEKASNALTVFPNPNQGVFTVSFKNKDLGNYKFNIYSTDGKLIYAENIQATSADFKKDVTIPEATNGIYYLQVISNGQVNKEKILITNK